MSRLRRLTGLLLAVAVLALTCAATAFSDDDDEPDADTSAATSVTASSAVLNGTVDPNGRGTKYFFEYGPTIAYGAQTNEGTAGNGHSNTPVAAVVTGLQPSTTYHFRVVATNAEGTDRGEDRTFTTAPAPPPDPGPGDPPADPTPDPGDAPDVKIPGEEEPDEPEIGKSVIVAPGEGELFVRRPGRSKFVPLDFGSELPLGTEVNALRGSIALTSALPGGKVQTARFGGGRFVIRQGRRGYVDLHMSGPACHPAPEGSRIARAAGSGSGRRLWGKDRDGRYRTHGKNSHATVRGTRWVVIDTCRGTLTRVSRGAVVVRDKVRRKSILVKAGEQYLARPKH